MNQRTRIVDQAQDAREWLDAGEAVRILGVKRETLYAYASRGLVRSAASSLRGARGRVYNRGDLDRLRARSHARAGHGPVAAGALRWGDPVLETRVGSIDGSGPRYRGRSAVQLARDGVSFEDVCALLWEVSSPLEDSQGARRFGAPVGPLRALLRSGAEPFDGMLVASATFAAAEPRAEASVEVARSRAPSLLRRLVASAGLVSGAEAVTASLEAETTARGLLVALRGRTTASAVAAITEALVLSADHELNASTFAARVAASAGANLPACVTGGLGALSGPLHGAATARIEALVTEIARPEKASAIIGERLARGESVPGFGHPLYPDGDPRGARLLEVAARAGGKTRGVRVITSIVDAMDLVARERPTLDVGLVALASALGLPRGASLAIFACGRIAGFIAHALEQRAAGYLLRPRARYVGA